MEHKLGLKTEVQSIGGEKSLADIAIPPCNEPLSPHTHLEPLWGVPQPMDRALSFFQLSGDRFDKGNRRKTKIKVISAYQRSDSCG